MINNKKSQSETVGFVLIIIIVTVIIMVFLYFMFRNSSNTPMSSADMSNLLSAFSEYTTNCSLTPPPAYMTGSDLIQDCYNNGGEMCLDGNSVCQTLNDTFKDIIGKTLDVGPNSQNKAYRITINYYLKGSDKNETWYTTQEGSFVGCTERYGGYYPVSANPGLLEVRLEVCRQTEASK